MTYSTFTAQLQIVHYYLSVHRQIITVQFFLVENGLLLTSSPPHTEGVLRSKNLFIKSDKSTQKPWAKNLSGPHRPFWGPLAAIFDFSGGVALQAVSKYPWRH